MLMRIGHFLRRRRRILTGRWKDDGQRTSFVYQGVKLEIPNALLTDRLRDAFERGYYEAAEAEHVPGILQDGERVLEIGAGIGFVSTIAALTGKASKVIAVEANPALIPAIKRNHELNHVDADVYNEILSAEEGVGHLHVHPDFWASSLTDWEGARRVEVRKTSLQRRLEEWRPTLIIVDIEGGEATLFDGVDLKGVSRIMLELHQEGIGRRGMKHVFDVLSAQGFHYDQWHSCKDVVTFTHVDRP
jgi:FkbM family methyltransferase